MNYFHWKCKFEKIIVFLNGRNGTRVKNFNLKVKIFLIWLNSHFYENFSSRNIEKKIELIRKKVSFCFTLKQYHIKNRTFIPFVKEFSRFSQFSSQNFILIFSYTVSSLIDEALIKRLLRLNSNNRLMNFTVDYDNSKGGFPIFKFFPLVFKNFNSFYKNQWEKWYKSSFIHFNQNKLRDELCKLSRNQTLKRKFLVVRDFWIIYEWLER